MLGGKKLLLKDDFVELFIFNKPMGRLKYFCFCILLYMIPKLMLFAWDYVEKLRSIYKYSYGLFMIFVVLLMIYLSINFTWKRCYHLFADKVSATITTVLLYGFVFVFFPVAGIMQICLFIVPGKDKSNEVSE